MADSIRKQVVDAIVSALEASTGIETVASNLRSWHDYNAHQFPIVTVLDRDTDLERLAFKSTHDDKEGMMEVLVRGYVIDMNNDTILKRTNLIRDVQKTLVTGTTDMDALIFDIEDTRIETDDGIQDNYSVFDIIYNVEYHYNHNTP